jgi:general secretion pathway protein J
LISKIRCTHSFGFLKKGKILRGFTLLEMLVVLVLVTLISTLLLEGVSYVLHLRSGFLTQLEESQKGTLQEHWFRSSVSAIITAYRKDEKNVFKGEKRQFNGLTIAPLDNVTGIPSSFAWQLKYDDGVTTLYYQNSQEESWEIAHWLGIEGHFLYRARDGEWHKKWPPFGLKMAQIPSVILLFGHRRQAEFTWIVKLSEHDNERIDTRDDW